MVEEKATIHFTCDLCGWEGAADRETWKHPAADKNIVMLNGKVAKLGIVPVDGNNRLINDALDVCNDCYDDFLEWLSLSINRRMSK